MRWAYPALWMSFIFATSCTVVSRPAFIRLVGRQLPGESMQRLWSELWFAGGIFVVKGYHLGEFALLFLLCRGAMRGFGGRRATIGSLILCLLFAIGDEWHQTFVRGRGGTWTDVAIDMGGVLLAALLTSGLERRRVDQAILVLSLLGLSWLGMQVVHEAGHVLLAWAAGETVSHEVHPLLVVWGGPVVGSVLPLVALGIARAFRSRLSYLVRFFAGFCLVANGLYLGVGSFQGVGDAGDLIRIGSPRWMLLLFGLATVPFGLFLWHGQGRHFGLGVSRRAAYGTLGLLSAVVLVEVLVG